MHTRSSQHSVDNIQDSKGLSQDDSHSAGASSHELQHKRDTNVAAPPHQLISPEFAYHLLLSIAFGTVALTTQRFKVLWIPHMCVLAAGALANLDGWRALLKRSGAIMSNHSVSHNHCLIM